MTRRRRAAPRTAAPPPSPPEVAASEARASESTSTGPPGAPGYAPALGAGFRATASAVQAMHHAIAGKTFHTLLRVPGLAWPTRVVQGVHDAITHGVYAAVRQGGNAAFGVAGAVERQVENASRVPSSREQQLRSALNGAFGDALAAAGSTLAVPMGLHDADGPITPERLARLPAHTCLFLHGLACDEHSWGIGQKSWAGSAHATLQAPGEPITYGAVLQRERGVGALWLRYNTGLAIEQNARLLAELLDRTAAAAPQVRDWVLIGHSMGGLVARRAQAIGGEERLGWAQRVAMIVCLGAPHQGAPLARLGHAAAAALGVSEVTRPLAGLANARSLGIQDLRHGLRGAAAGAPPLRLVYGTLGGEGEGAGAGDGPIDAERGADGEGDAVDVVDTARLPTASVTRSRSGRGTRSLNRLVGHWLGDGLVRAGSASADELEGDVRRVELAGLGHMSLLNHPRVLDVIEAWLADAASAG